MYGEKNACRFSKELYEDERIILKDILRKQNGRAMTGLM
jgi:hypothetical protein